MKAEFTNGPWGYMFQGNENDAGAHFIYSKGQMGNKSSHARTFINSQLDKKDSEANARLIAAAPELLEALQNIIEIGKRDLSNPKYDEYFISAEEAISKATGKGESADV
jgi:hypothetical protein